MQILMIKMNFIRDLIEKQRKSELLLQVNSEKEIFKVLAEPQNQKANKTYVWKCIISQKNWMNYSHFTQVTCFIEN